MMKAVDVIGKTLFHFILIGTVLSLNALIPVTAAEDDWNYRDQSKIKWRDYDKAAFAEAKAKNKPLYILVYADWCHWCKKFETETLETAPVRELFVESLIPVAVDNDMQSDLGKQLGARLVPTSVILTPDGKRLLRFYGFLGTKELEEAVQSTLVRWRKGEVPGEEFGDESTCCPVP